jgi:hypothetical protein
MLKTGLDGIDPDYCLKNKRDKGWPCVDGNEPLGCTKCRGFHEWLGNNLIPKDYSAGWQWHTFQSFDKAEPNSQFRGNTSVTT